MKSYFDKNKGVEVSVCSNCGYTYYDSGNENRNQDINRAEGGFLWISSKQCFNSQNGMITNNKKSIYVCPKCGVLQIEVR